MKNVVSRSPDPGAGSPRTKAGARMPSEPHARRERTAAVRAHQRGQAVFRSILPEDMDWKPFAAFPASARLAVVVGQPSEPGPYVIRVKMPSGVKLMPHRHPEDRIYTIMSGVFYIGLGDGLTPMSCRRIHPVASSFCRAIPPTFTGQSPESTSPR